MVRLLALVSLGVLSLTGCGDKDGPGGGGGDDTGAAPDDGGGGSGSLPTDDDGDGWAVEAGDCDDAAAAVYPGAVEACDGADNNCNGAVDEGHPDGDGDGIADCTDAEECDGLDNDGDGVVDNGFTDADADGTADCLDAEECDGLDNDGDGVVDEGWDGDGDGYSACAYTAQLDCDDTDGSVSPGAAEVAGDGVDNDCDGIPDEELWDGVSLVLTEVMNNPRLVADPVGEWFEIYNAGEVAVDLRGLTVDSGADTYQVGGGVPLVLEPGAYFVFGASDDPSVNGGVPVQYAWGSAIRLGNESDSLALVIDGLELDRIDWDDGVEWPDVAGASMALDGLLLNPGSNDGGDHWCATPASQSTIREAGTPGGANGLCPNQDRDDDGFAPTDGDCDDADPTVSPGVPEVAYDGIDNDCDAGTPDDDVDGDGFLVADDCDDDDADTYPAAAELCDGIDNDCDTLSDDFDPDVTGTTTWYADVDGDGFGDSGTGIDTCEPPTGLVDVANDCDDSDATINPDATEVPGDGIDQDCDGGDPSDIDRDGFDSVSVGGTDCDDSNNLVHPYAWEDTTDGVDNDCDGMTDTADTTVATRLSLSDDSFSTISWSGFSIEFCDTSYTSMHVSSNGRVTFASGSSSLSESSSTHASERAVALFWDDLNPSTAGSVQWINHGDAIGVYYREVAEYGSSSTRVTGHAIFFPDGRVQVGYGTVAITDGLAGWSCGGASASTEVNLGAVMDDVSDASGAYGQGTESNVWELYSGGTDANDLSAEVLVYCARAGVDADGDGWTTSCGDTDDSDAAVFPE